MAARVEAGVAAAETFAVAVMVEAGVAAADMMLPAQPTQAAKQCTRALHTIGAAESQDQKQLRRRVGRYVEDGHAG